MFYVRKERGMWRGSSHRLMTVLALAVWYVATLGGMLCATAGTNLEHSLDGPTLDVDGLLQGLRSTAKHFDPRVSTFYIQCREECEVFDETGRPIPGQAYWNEVEYARKKDMVFCHFRVKQQSDSKPEEEWDVWRDRVTAQRREGSIQIFPNLLPQCWNRSTYTDRLFMDCYQDLEFTSPPDFGPDVKRPSDGNILKLPGIVEENFAKYKLRPRLEAIDGFPCHVLEWPGIDIIWLDAAHGFLARKRQFSFNSKHLVTIWLNQNLEEFAPGFWLPKTQVTESYTSPHDRLKDGPPKLRRRYVTRLLKADFTPKEDDFFKIPVASDERMLVGDMVRQVTYWRRPKGTDALRNVIRDIPTRTQSPKWSYLLLINGLIIGLILIVMLARGLRKPVSKP